jgi:hypothetical protein
LTKYWHDDMVLAFDQCWHDDMVLTFEQVLA